LFDALVHRKPDPQNPFALVQALHDSGFKYCPLSGARVLNPSSETCKDLLSLYSTVQEGFADFSTGQVDAARFALVLKKFDSAVEAKALKLEQWTNGEGIEVVGHGIDNTVPGLAPCTDPW
jgi:hypothetical protein